MVVCVTPRAVVVVLRSWWCWLTAASAILRCPCFLLVRKNAAGDASACARPLHAHASHGHDRVHCCS